MHSTLNIGGIEISLDGGDGVRQTMLLPGMKVFETEEQAPQLKIHFDSEVNDSNCRWLHQFDIVDGYAECRFGIDTDGIYRYDFGVNGQLSCDMNNLTFSLTPFHDPAVLRFALWSAYSMGSILLGRVPVHSSVAVHSANGKSRAVMCLGESGTGKSTHTRLWLENIEGTHLLNDDSPILTIESGQAMVYGSPWSGKTHCYLREKHPVAALIRIVQHSTNTIEPLPTLQAFGALQPSCPPCLMKDERLADMLVDFVGEVIGCTPVYRLRCLPDADAARQAYCTTMK